MSGMMRVLILPPSSSLVPQLLLLEVHRDELDGNPIVHVCASENQQKAIKFYTKTQKQFLAIIILLSHQLRHNIWWYRMPPAERL
jgi:hypothetical protein